MLIGACIRKWANRHWAKGCYELRFYDNLVEVREEFSVEAENRGSV